jgi:hypothetical protein
MELCEEKRAGDLSTHCQPAPVAYCVRDDECWPTAAQCEPSSGDENPCVETR